MKKKQLILASSSPQRLILLKTIGVIPDQIVPANIDEIPEKNETPDDGAWNTLRKIPRKASFENQGRNMFQLGERKPDRASKGLCSNGRAYWL